MELKSSETHVPVFQLSLEPKTSGTREKFEGFRSNGNVLVEMTSKKYSAGPTATRRNIVQVMYKYKMIVILILIHFGDREGAIIISKLYNANLGQLKKDCPESERK